MSKIFSVIVFLYASITGFAQFGFYGGPISDAGANGSKIALLVNEKNILNILRNDHSLEQSKLSTMRSVSSVLGQVLASDFMLGSDDKLDRPEAEILEQAAMAKKAAGEDSIAVVSIQREADYLKSMRTFRDNLKIQMARNRTPLNMVQRLKLLNETRMLNTQLFLLKYHRDAEVAAVRADLEQKKTDIRQREAIVRAVQERVGEPQESK